MSWCSKAILSVALFGAVECCAESLYEWNFNKVNDAKGWSVSEPPRSVVMGGALWVTLAPPLSLRKDLYKSAYQVFGGSLSSLKNTPQAHSVIAITSPPGLPRLLSFEGDLQVTLRVINLSPIMSIDVSGIDAKGEVAKTHKCAIEADEKNWQTITCYLPNVSKGQLNKVALQIPPPLRGDIWLDRIQLSKGSAPPPPARPDVASDKVVPKISIEGLSQAGFADAFRVMDEMMYVDVPINGFPYPIMRPGGVYQNW